jgi:hypothetical protein
MEEKLKIQRGISPIELDAMNIPTLQFTGEWLDAYDKPEATGVWFIWGNSGNGKTRFIAQLSKYLTQFGKVVVNSLEEGASNAMQRAWRNVNMKEVTGKIHLVRESMEHLQVRLDRRKGPSIAVIDSVQYSKLNSTAFMEMKEKYAGKKLLIFISQAEGSDPKGATSDTIMYDASLKIWVEGYRAYTKGRSIGPKGYYTIWDEGAAIYWGDN